MGSLFIKYQSGDAGVRPINPCTGFWVSPSLWLTGGIDATTAQVGVVNTIHAVVDNMASGQEKTGVRVQVWVCDFTIGVGPAAVTASSPGGAAGTIRTIGTVLAGASGEATIDWTPTEDDLINNNDPTSGHVCLGANCYTLTDSVPEGAQWTPMAQFLNICGDQHHAQKNIQVSLLVPGILTTFYLRVANGLTRPERFNLAVREASLEQLGLAEREHLLGGAAIQPVGLSAEEVERIKAETRGEPAERALLRAGARLHLANTDRDIALRSAERPAQELQIIADDRRAADLDLDLEGGTAKPIAVDVVVPRNTPFGTVNVVDVVQSNSRGQLVGGARLMTVAVPRELKPTFSVDVPDSQGA
jgi:hypothetical protein